MHPILITLLLSSLLHMNRKVKQEASSEKKSQKSKPFKKTVHFKKHFKINKNTAEPLNPEDISISINNNLSDQEERKPDYFILSILWAHFQACQQDKLSRDGPAPWEIIIDDEKYGNKEEILWYQFLEKINQQDVQSWISSIEGVKANTLKAYKTIN